LGSSQDLAFRHVAFDGGYTLFVQDFPLERGYTSAEEEEGTLWYGLCRYAGLKDRLRNCDTYGLE